ncbi:MAG TPA: UDP-N-acetylmuramate dehydrogenase [Candidatus Phocaeicola excrementigallinarum]|nr:UDP-N-acetylmuramate dehydrogenase [Candidatus Phocaeicola excrementigallinarum]
MTEYTDYSLLPHNTFRLDVKAARFMEYSSEEELTAFLASGGLTSPYLHIGGGSNLLFLSDYPGLVLHSSVKGVETVAETDERVELRVGSGVVWDDFVAYTVEKGFYGAENLSLIPGEVGASAVQNIGAYGVEVKDLVVSVDAVEAATGKKRRFTREECRYAYRDSIFKKELKGRYFVTYVTYRLSKLPVFHLDYGNVRAELEKDGMEPTLANVRRVIAAIRSNKLPDPKVTGNAGSFFMNPVVSQEQFDRLQTEYSEMPSYRLDGNRVKIPAGWLIERCGWKGKALGPAAVHDRQALVLVNRGGATGRDVLRLADEVARSVKERFGIEISPEVNLIG